MWLEDTAGTKTILTNIAFALTKYISKETC